MYCLFLQTFLTTANENKLSSDSIHCPKKTHLCHSYFYTDRTYPNRLRPKKKASSTLKNSPVFKTSPRQILRPDVLRCRTADTMDAPQ